MLALGLLVLGNLPAPTAPVARAADVVYSDVTFVARADARVEEATPGTNRGASNHLQVDGGGDPDIESYLRFDVAGVAGVVQRASLRLYAITNSTDGPGLFATSSDWGEATISWETRPGPSSNAVVDSQAIAANSWVELDVTPLVTGDGTYSFVLATDNGDGVTFFSREGSFPPELVLTLAVPATPTSTPTSEPTATNTPTPEPTATNTPAPTAMSSPTPTAEVTAVPGLAQRRPYTDNSAWNTPIEAAPEYDPNTTAMIETIGLHSDGGIITSDPDQYSYPVYFVDGSTPRWDVPCTWYKCMIVSADGTVTRVSTLAGVPIPADAEPGTGSDGQMIIVDKTTGTEYDLWQAERTETGWKVSNGSVYNVSWDGMPKEYGSRGAGVPYLAGLIRPWEIRQGRIDHAIAFAYPYSAQGRCVFPASKTDGQSALPYAIPEGARLQLDPSLTEADFDRMGLSRTGKIIARALQEYGMINIDVSGRPKIIAENLRDNPYATEQWTDPELNLTEMSIASIPYTAFRVLSLPAAYWTGATGSTLHGKCYAHDDPSPTPTSDPLATPVPSPTPGSSPRLKQVTFEDGDLYHAVSGVDDLRGTVTLENAVPLKGQYGARVGPVANSYLQEIFTPVEDLYVSFYLRLNALPASRVRLALIENDGTSVGSIFLLPSGALQLRRGSTTPIGLNTEPLQVDTLYRVGLHQRLGTGADAVLEAYLAAGDAGFEAPFAVTTSGDWTTPADRLRIGWTTAGTADITVDEITLDTAAMPHASP